MKKLVIVESPSKSRTIEKYLGNDYKVVSSKGHIRDLATSGKGGLGIDIENHFTPTYVISKDKKETVKELKETAKKCSEIYLASDPDREGEAIAWHLAEVLEVDKAFPNKTNVEFIEIVDKNNIKMRVWERGAGETLACGTGASASGVACVLNNLTNRKVLVELLGGNLEIEWNEKDNHVYMTGPAVTVFEGILN